MAKKTILQIVKENESELKLAVNHLELKQWGIEHGFDNRSAFPKFKSALLEIGIDYDEMKGVSHQQSAEDIETQIEYSLTLFVDAKASANGFGICDRNGDVLWYGKFFHDEDAEEQSKAELCAAKKAVWLAGKVKEAVGNKPIHLQLMVDAQWLTYQDHGGQKGYVLTQLARKYGLKLEVEWIPGKENPADFYTTKSRYKSWEDNDLTKLCVLYKIKAEDL